MVVCVSTTVKGVKGGSVDTVVVKGKLEVAMGTRDTTGV